MGSPTVQIRVESGNLSVKSLRFTSTTTSPYPAAIQYEADDTIWVNDCIFENYEQAITSWGKYLDVNNCQFLDCAKSESAAAIYVGIASGNGIISNCSFVNHRIETYGQHQSIYMFFYTFGDGNFSISNNIFSGYQEAINVTLSPGLVIIENNIFNNNVLVAQPSPAISAPYLFLGTPDVVVRNNLFEGNYTDETVGEDIVCLDLRAYSNAEVYNNVFVGVQPGIRVWQHAYFGIPYAATVDNNDFWLHSDCPSIILREGAIGFPSTYDSLACEDYQKITDSSFTLVSSNICRNPMLVDSIDYFLQAGSPCIDAGRSGILDIDGSRSDIGPFGGTAGSFYSYQDFPPASPVAFNGAAKSDSATLVWERNSESDLWYYALFESTSGVVTLDSNHVIGYLVQVDDFLLRQTPDDNRTLLWVDTTFSPVIGARYTIVAVDSNGLVSEPASEVVFVGTEVSDDEDLVLPQTIELEQNYPNPFNATTAIVYSLPNIGAQPAAVKLVIFNSLGQQVRVLVDQAQAPGKQVAYWDGNDDGGDAVASGVYFYSLKVSGVELVKKRKMVVVK